MLHSSVIGITSMPTSMRSMHRAREFFNGSGVLFEKLFRQPRRLIA
jgi:hypothetical protein